LGSVVVTLWRAEPVPAGSPANFIRGDEKMKRKALVTTTPTTKEAGLAELRRIVEGLPNAENLLGLLLRKGALKPDDFMRLFSQDDEVRDQICGSIRQAIQCWVLQRFPQFKELDDLINSIFIKVFIAVNDRYDPTRAPLLAYAHPYFQKGYDEVVRHLAIQSVEQPESAMTESIALEDETEEVAESFLERMPSKLPSPEDKAIAKETSDKLAERVGFQSGAELLATLEDTEALQKVKRHRLRKQLQKAIETLPTEVKMPMPSDEARLICSCRDEFIPLVSFRAFGVAYFLWKCPNCGRRLIAPKDHLKVVDSDGYVKGNIRRPVEEAVVRKEISQERRARRLLQRIRGRTSWR
jgi:hypothetical protein